MKTNLVTATTTQSPTLLLTTWPWGVLTATVAFLCAAYPVLPMIEDALSAHGRR